MLTKSTVVKLSYLLISLVLFTVAWFKIQTTFITILFSYFMLTIFSQFSTVVLKRKEHKWAAIIVFVIVVCGIFYGFAVFVRQALDFLPGALSAAIPTAQEYARKYRIELPFNDINSLMAVLVGTIKEELHGVAHFAELATKEFVFLILGMVVAISIFINGNLDLDEQNYKLKNNLYSLLCSELSTRFKNFYKSFETVMGAQIVISSINTLFTGIFITAIGLPQAKIVTATTFLCGLVPIVGNLVSNTIITLIAMRESLQMAVFALIFLIVLHKLEYFLNSKIIGGKIKNPMWLTLLSLIVGERVMGIPGMILAPVLLNYLKLEGSATEVKV